MNSRPDFTDPYEAARVSTFMEKNGHGRWRLQPFTYTEHQSKMAYLAAYAEGGLDVEMRAARTIPPGDYICLMRRMTAAERKDIEDGLVVDAEAPDGDPRYMPIMSDTPSEIREHAAAIEEASGKVLITGLGLGCIVSALLAKPDVEHITVVEIDRDVIALTGPYYQDDPRVTIVNMDARAAAPYFADQGEFFDYAWHDIWSHIADRNLDDDDLAEHGLSYATIFQLYSDVADAQDAWAYDLAVQMMQVKTIKRHEAQRWADAFTSPNATDGQRSELLVYWHVVNQLPQFNLGDRIPEDLYRFLVEQLEIRERVAAQVKARGGFKKMVAEVRLSADESLYDDEDEPMGHPNAVPEANVA
jgi:hypothetical protein